MTQIDLEDVAAALEVDDVTVEFVDGAQQATEVPPQWRPIAESSDAQDRCSMALSQWNTDFLRLLPRFAHELREKLLDVRVCRLCDEWAALIYVVAAGEGYALWIGWDPADFGDAEPPFWETLPTAARTFLREVHAGFTGPDWEAYGLMRPIHMETFAQHAGYPDGVPGWIGGREGEVQLASERLLWITKDEGALFYCTSPDLPPGRIVLIYEGNIDPPGEFGSQLDDLMAGRLER